MKEQDSIRAVFSMPVLVAALGYFVDIYDLVLFSIVRVPSLTALGFSGHELVDQGVFLLDMQMTGMLLGGLLWGWLGDTKGRLKIMFASILMYSIANIANGFATSLPIYAFLRFVAGIGLAGELGAGITLVSEVLHTKVRGYGTMLVASIGVSGAIVANIVAHTFEWHHAFFIGGGLGLLLLLARVRVAESGIFEAMENSTGVSRGNFFALFTDGKRFMRYLNSILIGIPIWFIVGVLITFSPEFALAFGVQGAISAGDAVMYCYLGLVLGDLSSGLLSQLMQSRKKAILIFLLMTTGGIGLYFRQEAATPGFFYAVCGFLGFASGYWAIFVTVAAEQFGTNLRATVATTVPNFVRGAVVPITMLFQYSRGFFGMEVGALVVGAICLLSAFLALAALDETFHRDLDYYEHVN